MCLNICLSFKNRKGCREFIAQESANVLFIFSDQSKHVTVLCYVVKIFVIECTCT